MKPDKRRKLQDNGWTVGTADEFLGMSPEESAYLDIRMALAEGLRASRTGQHMTQVQLARRLQSSQSRVAKMESGDPSVTIDLLIRSLLSLGVSRKDVASLIL